MYLLQLLSLLLIPLLSFSPSSLAAANPLQQDPYLENHAQEPQEAMQLRSHASDNFCRNDDMHIQLRMDFSSLTPTTPSTPTPISAPDTPTTSTMPSSRLLPPEIESGQYQFWSVTSFGTEPLSITVDTSTDVLWCRMNYDGKIIIIRAEQVLSRAKATQRGPQRWIQVPFVWRAESTHFGSALVDDVALKGDISFARDEDDGKGDFNRHGRRIEIALDGANMGRESWVEGKRKQDLGKDAGDLVEEIERQWGELESNEDQADLALVRSHYGSILSLKHMRSHHAEI